MEIDHVVLWVDDAERAVRFYRDVLGLEPVRLEEFRRGETSFPSVRISAGSILDLLPRARAERTRALTGERVRTGAGEPLNHLCLAMSVAELDALRGRLQAEGVPFKPEDGLTGARGDAVEAFYFQDPAGNLIEARHYGRGTA